LIPCARTVLENIDKREEAALLILDWASIALGTNSAASVIVGWTGRASGAYQDRGGRRRFL